MVGSFMILIFPSLAYAYTTFDTNCSVPTNSTNFVHSKSTRGTLDILWSCLFTIIACTWTVQHLNVPEQREGRDPGTWGDIWWAIKRGWTRTKWMLITVLAPEVLLAKNVGDIVVANADLKELQDWAAQDGVPWTRTHSLFANMGGFVMRRIPPERVATISFPGDAKDPERPTPRPRINKTTGWEAKLYGKLGWKSESDVEIHPSDAYMHNSTESKEPWTAERGLSLSESSSQPVLIHLLTEDILLLRSKGLLPKLPYITLEEINDKSKSDSLVRAITVVQIIWIVIQVIARGIYSLAISQLEISVVAFAACAIILYGINWEKPKGVQVPITIMSYVGPFPEDTIEIVKAKRDEDESILAGVVQIGLELRRSYKQTSQYRWRLGKPIPNDYSRTVPWTDSMVDDFPCTQSDVFGLFLGTTVFGAVHIAAWNFDFPTPIEGILWKAAAVFCTTISLVFVGLLVLCILQDYVPGLPVIAAISTLIFVATYVVCRLFIIVEVFRCLLFLPPSAYIDTWATNVPHIT